MDQSAIRAHWTDWARTYGSGLRATTKSSTAKALELDALARRFAEIIKRKPNASILEAGCGNGVNCLHLAKIFTRATFDGIDFIPEMIDTANQAATDRTNFRVCDVLNLSDAAGIKDRYDIVFTNRCLINLNTVDMQKAGISSLSSKLAPDGLLVMIENSKTTYAEQNRCREALGLSPRKQADFNLFFDEAEIRKHIASIGMDLIDVEDFSSLHDLALYVLAPALDGGAINYDHPLVHAATRLSLETQSSFGSYGQNRMFVCRKKQ